MFLSDKLKEIVDNTELNEQAINASLKQMVQECFQNIEEQTKHPNKTDQAYISAFQRCKLIWNQTAEYAKKQNKGFMAENGFAELVRANDKFGVMHKFL